MGIFDEEAKRMSMEEMKRLAFASRLWDEMTQVAGEVADDWQSYLSTTFQSTDAHIIKHEN
jgi:hypothetical protein